VGFLERREREVMSALAIRLLPNRSGLEVTAADLRVIVTRRPNYA
jgi:hypothetical protein